MELTLPPLPIYRNPLNGRFLKGHVPFNKGLKWEDYMDMRKARRIKKNLEINRRKGNPNLPGANRKEVVGIRDGKLVCVFSSSCEAGRKLGIISRNIRHCCEKKRKCCGGIMWFYSKSDEWIGLINN